MSILLHYHIRWLLSGKLQWQRFETPHDAEQRAKELATRDERYVIEPIVGDCETCAALSPRTAAPESAQKKAASR